MHLKSSIILVQTLAIITYIASAVIINDNHVNNNINPSSINALRIEPSPDVLEVRAHFDKTKLA